MNNKSHIHARVIITHNNRSRVLVIHLKITYIAPFGSYVDPLISYWANFVTSGVTSSTMNIWKIRVVSDNYTRSCDNV